jgi:excisionase family DNA binding protein
MTSNLQQRRLSPDDFSAPDRRRLDLLASVMNQPRSPALVGDNGERLELPGSIYRVLREIVNGMREGRPMLVIPENEVLTTQAAANVLGVSRPHFVSLLDNDEIPYHTVGTHRRVHFGDVNAYREKRDQERRQGLDALTRRISDAGFYDQDATDEG